MRPKIPTVFFLGPPAAGKTTIGRAVATKLGRCFRTIDDWTPCGVRMTDTQVELALAQLMNATLPTGEIVEFCYHAYEHLVRSNAHPVFTNAPKVVVLASLAICRGRNQRRRSPVQDEYVERAWRSSMWLAETETSLHPNTALVIDTDRQAEKDTVELVSKFLLTLTRSNAQ